MLVGLSLQEPGGTRESNREPSAPLLRHRAREPIEALEEAIAGGRHGGLHMPLRLWRRQGTGVQSELPGDLIRRGRTGQVLLVRKYQQHRLPQLLRRQQFLQLLPRVLQSVTIAAVHDEDEAVGVSEVVPPQLADLILAADVPNVEVDVPVLHGLHVEADGGHGREHLAHLQAVKDCGLASSIESEHKDALVLVAQQALPHLAEGDAHGMLLLGAPPKTFGQSDLAKTA
mmetsp:Transcript_23928/g.65196  ORF Transcript_23928/g.65196 Transcript_23928/m.65196 type:complete len:229 (+) Transcript_23928:314-1000(+)